MNTVECPRCGATEINPATGLLWIRVHKVMTNGIWDSHCMRCHCWFNDFDTAAQVTQCREVCYCYECYPATEANDVHEGNIKPHSRDGDHHITHLHRH